MRNPVPIPQGTPAAALKPVAGQESLNPALSVRHGDPILAAGHGRIPPQGDVGAFFKRQLTRGVLLAFLVPIKPLTPVLYAQAATKTVADRI
ncbi:MAG: hypothetical protein ABIQ90_08805 [Polaromonas sp.]